MIPLRGTLSGGTTRAYVAISQAPGLAAGATVSLVCSEAIYGPPLFPWQTESRRTDSNNNNHNHHHHHTNADVYGAVIMAEPLREFTRFI